MKHSLSITLLALASILPALAQHSTDAAPGLLHTTEPYSAKATISITLPITQQEITYYANVYSNHSNDRLLPVKYLIEATDSLDSQSFFAYFNGNYYTYSGQKFREYHWAQDSVPFIDKSTPNRYSPGVHKSGLFSFLIPALLSEQLNHLAQNADNIISHTSDTLVWGKRCSVIKAEERINGVTSREMEYISDFITRRPVRYRLISSPATTGEQSIEIVFSHNSNDTIAIDEQALINRYADIFSAHRTNTFSASNLAGTRLPAFTLPSLSGERYIWETPQPSPTALIFINSAEGTTAETIKAVNDAIDESPITITPLWIFTDKNPDEHTISTLDGTPRSTIMFNAQRLATQLGIASTPAILTIDKNGTVKNTLLGYSPTLNQELIQQFILSGN